MRIAVSRLTIPLLLGAALSLSACANRPPVQAVAPPAPPPAAPAVKPPKIVRAKRADPNCVDARVELSAERKDELFRQFAAEQGSGTTLASEPEPEPAPVPRCKQAAK